MGPARALTCHFSCCWQRFLRAAATAVKYRSQALCTAARPRPTLSWPADPHKTSNQCLYSIWLAELPAAWLPAAGRSHHSNCQLLTTHKLAQFTTAAAGPGRHQCLPPGRNSLTSYDCNTPPLHCLHAENSTMGRINNGPPISLDLSDTLCWAVCINLILVARKSMKNP